MNEGVWSIAGNPWIFSGAEVGGIWRMEGLIKSHEDPPPAFVCCFESAGAASGAAAGAREECGVVV